MSCLPRGLWCDWLALGFIIRYLGDSSWRKVGIFAGKWSWISWLQLTNCMSGCLTKSRPRKSAVCFHLPTAGWFHAAIAAVSGDIRRIRFFEYLLELDYLGFDVELYNWLHWWVSWDVLFESQLVDSINIVAIISREPRDLLHVRLTSADWAMRCCVVKSIELARK